MYSTIIDNNLIASLSQGETLGNRQDAVVRSLVAKQELELAA